MNTPRQTETDGECVWVRDSERARDQKKERQKERKRERTKERKKEERDIEIRDGRWGDLGGRLMQDSSAEVTPESPHPLPQLGPH